MSDSQVTISKVDDLLALLASMSPIDAVCAGILLTDPKTVFTVRKATDQRIHDLHVSGQCPYWKIAHIINMPERSILRRLQRYTRTENA